MANTPPPKGLLDRLKTLLPGGEPADTPPPRWPHRTRRWLDPKVHLHPWRNRIDEGDVPEALQAIADTSDGRVDATAVAEVLDAVREKELASFRFGAPEAYRQVWIGVSPEETGGIRIFLLSDTLHVERVEAALSVAGFHHLDKRPEYDRLGRFLVAIWEWRGSAAPSAIRLDHKEATLLSARLKRMVSDSMSPALEVLRGLRMRSREMVGELSHLSEPEVKAVDQWLAERGAPTLTQMRRLVG